MAASSFFIIVKFSELSYDKKTAQLGSFLTVPMITPDYTYDGGREIIEEYLEAEQWDVDVIYSQNDDMALGAIIALENH